MNEGVIWYNMEQACNFLDLTPPTVRKKVDEGKLTAYYIGNGWKFKEEDLIKYIESCRIKATNEEREK